MTDVETARHLKVEPIFITRDTVRSSCYDLAVLMTSLPNHAKSSQILFGFFGADSISSSSSSRAMSSTLVWIDRVGRSLCSRILASRQSHGPTCHI